MTRAVWQGTISFGLVHVPVRIFPNGKRDEPEFFWIDRRDHAPIGLLKINKRTGEEVGPRDLARAFRNDRGDLTLLPEEEPGERPSRPAPLSILSFVPAASIPPVYYKTPYYLEPTPEGEKGYALLREVLERTRRIGLVRLTLRGQDSIAAVMPDGPLLILVALRFAEQLVHPRRLRIPPPTLESLGVTAQEIGLAERLVEEMSAPLDLLQYRSESRARRLARVRREAERAAQAAAEPPPPKPTERGMFAQRLEESIRNASQVRARRGPRIA
jgi:DNA end-binding protein Ku